MTDIYLMNCRYCKCWTYSMPDVEAFKITTGGAGKYSQKLHLEIDSGVTDGVPCKDARPPRTHPCRWFPTPTPPPGYR
jgi:hypothetical protein